MVPSQKHHSLAGIYLVTPGLSRYRRAWGTLRSTPKAKVRIRISDQMTIGIIAIIAIGLTMVLAAYLAGSPNLFLFGTPGAAPSGNDRVCLLSNLLICCLCHS